MKKTIHITKQKVMELIGEHDLCEIHDDCGRQAMSDCFEELFGFILYICDGQEDYEETLCEAADSLLESLSGSTKFEIKYKREYEDNLKDEIIIIIKNILCSVLGEDDPDRYTVTLPHVLHFVRGHQMRIDPDDVARAETNIAVAVKVAPNIKFGKISWSEPDEIDLARICEDQFSRHPFIELDYQDEIRGLIADRVIKVLRSRRSVIIDDDTSAV